MARIRSIKPEFWSSEQVMSVSRDARLLFIGIWNFSDDAGRSPLKVGTIKAQILPGDDVTASEMKGWLSELIQVGLLECYRNGHGTFLNVSGWAHQKINKPQQPKYPNPKDCERVDSPFPEYSRNTPGILPDGSDRIQEDPKGSDPPDPPEPDDEPPEPRPGLAKSAHATAPPSSAGYAQDFDLALGEAAGALGWRPAPSVGYSMRTRVIERCRSHAASSGKSFLEACREIALDGLRLARETGKSPAAALLEVEPGKPVRAPPGRRKGHVPRAPPTTGADFADAAPIEDQLKHLFGDAS